MVLENCTVTINGITYSPSSVEVIMEPGIVETAKIEVPLIRGWKEEKVMGYCNDDKACEDGYSSGNDLAREMRKLELDEDEQLLRKYELVNEDGTLTSKGKDFLLNVAFDGYREEVVEALVQIEESKKPKVTVEE